MKTIHFVRLLQYFRVRLKSVLVRNVLKINACGVKMSALIVVIFVIFN